MVLTEQAKGITWHIRVAVGVGLCDAVPVLVAVVVQQEQLLAVVLLVVVVALLLLAVVLLVSILWRF